MIDAHCHLANPKIADHLQAIVAQAKQAGITHFVQAGINASDWVAQVQLQKIFGDSIQMVAGLHPYQIGQMTKEGLKFALLELEQFVSSHSVSAIGEIGLDFRELYAPNSAVKSLQSDAFLIQTQFANRIKKPCVFHVVRAHDEALRLMKICPPKNGGIVHAFTANPSVAERYLAQNLSISIGTAILNPKNEGLRQSVRRIPLDRLLIESDAPDQAPAGWKEPFNTPLCLPLIAEAIAHERQESASRIAASTRANAARIFGITLQT